MDIVTLFNRLTNTELADCKLFEKILDRHYDKFKYFYYLIEKMSKEDIEKITCQIEDDELIFQTKLASVRESKKFTKYFENYLLDFTDDYYKKYFSCSVFMINRTVSIVVKNKDMYKTNETIYDDRFKFF